MWNFSDLAKKAQELTEQTSSASSMFNLDAMLTDSAPPPPPNKPQEPKSTSTSARTTTATFPSTSTSSFFSSLPLPSPTPTPTPPPPPQQNPMSLFSSMSLDHMTSLSHPSQQQQQKLTTPPPIQQQPTLKTATKLKVPTRKIEQPPQTQTPPVETSDNNDWNNDDWDFDAVDSKESNDDAPDATTIQTQKQTLPFLSLLSTTQQTTPNPQTKTAITTIVADRDPSNNDAKPISTPNESVQPMVGMVGPSTDQNETLALETLTVGDRLDAHAKEPMPTKTTATPYTTTDKKSLVEEIAGEQRIQHITETSPLTTDEDTTDTPPAVEINQEPPSEDIKEELPAEGTEKPQAAEDIKEEPPAEDITEEPPVEGMTEEPQAEDITDQAPAQDIAEEPPADALLPVDDDEEVAVVTTTSNAWSDDLDEMYDESDDDDDDDNDDDHERDDSPPVVSPIAAQIESFDVLNTPEPTSELAAEVPVLQEEKAEFLPDATAGEVEASHQAGIGTEEPQIALPLKSENYSMPKEEARSNDETVAAFPATVPQPTYDESMISLNEEQVLEEPNVVVTQNIVQTVPALSSTALFSSTSVTGPEPTASATSKAPEVEKIVKTAPSSSSSSMGWFQSPSVVESSALASSMGFFQAAMSTTPFSAVSPAVSKDEDDERKNEAPTSLEDDIAGMLDDDQSQHRSEDAATGMVVNSTLPIVPQQQTREEIASGKSDVTVTETVNDLVMKQSSASALPFVPSAPIGSRENMVPNILVEKLTNQLQRLEEHHHSELIDLQKSHTQEIQLLKESLTQKSDAERTQLEQRFLSRLREKDEQLQEIMRINEGMKLKMDVLKRELEGTQHLLGERDTVLGSTSAAYDRDKQKLEEQLKTLKESAGTAQADVYQLKNQIVAKERELEESNEAYTALKARVKMVATELKDRRAECRTLAQTNVELNDANEQLKEQIKILQSQVDDQDRSGAEKAEERDMLREKVKALEEELKEKEKKIEERDAVGEKALAAYKKKAQNSLAVANARAAAALQAKEEAELEARAARSTADDAVKRARKAEAKGNDSLAEAKAYVQEMEVQKALIESQANEAIHSFAKTQAELEEAKAEAEAASLAREKMAREITSLNHELQEEKNKSSELLQEASDLQKRANHLYDEVETLRDELRKSATAAFMANETDQSITNGGATDASGNGRSVSAVASATEKSEAEATILILQQDLQDANQAIKELKETLRSTIESSNPALSEQNGITAASLPSAMHLSTDTPQGNGSSNNDSTPLFYAMEKQAELNQAREEINRLATLLGELQSEKMQAYDAVADMKREKESAEARLARFEKLGSGGSSIVNNHKRTNPSRMQSSTTGGGYGARKIDSDAMSVGSVESHEDLDGPRGDSMNSSNNNSSAQVNLEYLKNVMLSYLKAKTLNERKRLVPAVAAVLCLTPEEAAGAMKSVADSGSVESVGLSFFESLGALKM